MAVLELSEVELENNVLHGGGVAGVLLQGKATISSNDFKGNGRAMADPEFRRVGAGRINGGVSRQHRNALATCPPFSRCTYSEGS